MNDVMANATKLTLCICMVIVTIGFALGKISSDDFKIALGAAGAAHLGTSAALGFAKKDG